MSTVRKCDVCGSLIPDEKERPKEYRQALVKVMLTDIENDYPTAYWIDLCTDCVGKLIDNLNGGSQ